MSEEGNKNEKVFVLEATKKVHGEVPGKDTYKAELAGESGLPEGWAKVKIIIEFEGGHEFNDFRVGHYYDVKLAKQQRTLPEFDNEQDEEAAEEESEEESKGIDYGG